MRMKISDIDRGWAWIVVVAVFLYHMLSYGLVWSAGVYNAILIEVYPEESKVMVSWAGALPTFGMYAAGPISGILTNKYGCRFVIILGGILAGFGMMLCYFSPNLHYLYVTFGIITGLGVGLSYIPAVTALTLYFRKYRNIATGIAVSGAGFGCFIFPPIINSLSSVYSWRESMLIIGAIELNIVVCGALIRPTSGGIIPEVEKPKVLDISPLRKKGYIFLCINIVLFCSGLSTVYLHLPAYAELNGVDTGQSAMLMSAIGIANLCGRFVLGATANHPKVDVMVYYGACNCISGIACVCFAFSSASYPGLVFLACVFGFCSACFGALLPAILIELLGLKRFSNGYGCLLIFMAIGQLAGGPFAGFLYDLTGTYEVPLFVEGGIIILAGLTMKLVGCCSKKMADEPAEFEISFIEHGSGTLKTPICDMVA